MECYRVVSYKLADISELLTTSIISSISEPCEKCNRRMLQSEQEGDIFDKFKFKP
jgi:hypothetical protein